MDSGKRATVRADVIRLTARQPMFVTLSELAGAGQITDEQKEKGPRCDPGASVGYSRTVARAGTLRARRAGVKPPCVSVRGGVEAFEFGRVWTSWAV
jgi:hypothetical protein